MPSTDDREFYLRVADAICDCQLVEQELKLYISEALELARRCVAGKLPFDMNGQHYENEPLGRLIQVFERLSDCPELVTKLNAFTKERNFLAHRGIAHCLDPDGELDIPTTAKFEERLAAIAPEAQRLRTAIHNEANKFRGHLYFGEPSTGP